MFIPTQDLMAELDRQAKAMSNGPVAVQTLSNGSDDKPTPDKREVKEVAVLEKKLKVLKSKYDVQ